jgi:hypothetical protein
MESNTTILYPLRENAESFYQIYCDLTEGAYEKSYLETLIKLSKVFYDSMGKVIEYKSLIAERRKEFEACNCQLMKFCIESEIFNLADKLDYLLGTNTSKPYDESCIETAQEIIQFYFDSLESQG